MIMFKRKTSVSAIIAFHFKRYQSSLQYVMNNKMEECYKMEHTKNIRSKVMLSASQQTSKRIDQQIDRSTQITLSKLNDCDGIASVLQLIRHKDATHISIFAKALQTCHRLSRTQNDQQQQQHGYIKTIFDLVERRGIALNHYFFSILFDVLSKTKFEAPDLLFYFQTMQSVHSKLKPNAIILNTLLKCCRKLNDIKLAEKMLHLLRDIALDRYALNELIALYGANQCVDTARSYFEKSCALQSQGNQPDIVSYGAMLNAFAEVGDVASMKQLVKQMKQNVQLVYGMQNNPVIYAAFMKAYIRCSPSKPKKTISIFDAMVAAPKPEGGSRKCTVLDVHINLLATAYVHLIRRYAEEIGAPAKAMKYRNALLFEVPKLRQQHVSSVNALSQQLAALQLKGCCIAHQYEYDCPELIALFEQHLQPFIGVWSKPIANDNGQSASFVLTLDLFYFSEIMARFMLRYMYKYQKEQLVNALDENGVLKIVCDDSLHRKYHAITGKQQLKITEFSDVKDVIKEEVLIWDESIHISMDTQDTRCLLVNMSHMCNDK